MPADRDLRLSMLHKWKARARCCVCAAMAIICAASYLLVLALQVLALQGLPVEVNFYTLSHRARC